MKLVKEKLHIFGKLQKYEENILNYEIIILIGLIIEDLFAKVFFAHAAWRDAIFLMVQAFLMAIIVSVNIYERFMAKKQNGSTMLVTLAKILKCVALTSYISTLWHGVFFYIVPLLPIAFHCISKGCKKTAPLLITSWLSQLGSQLLLCSVIYSGIDRRGAMEYFIGLTVKYALFGLFSYICGRIYRLYMRGQEENSILIDRLSDKYVQLEQAKKEIQAHNDRLMDTNRKLEEINQKLTSSIAEFFTLQQISQAITSIFDVNELLKYVNDVIMGVMGAYHSTIALCGGPQNKLKVKVSSIFDKKDFAIVSDYINSDVLQPCIYEGKSMIDNDVDPENYPFTKGRNIHSLICVPFLAKGVPLGLVLVEHSIKDAFNNENVRLLEIICQQVSIAIENARLYQQMQKLATLDGLTGAYNRQYFQDKLETEFNKAQQGNYNLSLIIFDIDYFKKFNDTYGHLFGDQILKALSSYVMKTLRKEDIFARYGGEEFVILMPHTSLELAAEKAEELRKGISELAITNNLVAASVNISAGVASYPKTARRPIDLLNSADDALYMAKRGGRNLVKVAKPLED